MSERTEGGGDLGDPAVPATAYDRHYFLRICMGSKEWRESGGGRMDGLYLGMLRRARFRPGMRVLDVGTGRGELVRAAMELGATEAVGVDYSPAAIELSGSTLAGGDWGGRARVVLADARRLPVEDDHFDLVTMLDVVEHLTPEELDVALAEARRALRPRGELFVHTMPNRRIYDVTYRLQRCLRPGRARRWPADPRGSYERAMHVNEQTPRTLRRSLRRAGFGKVAISLGDWVYTDFVPEEKARRLYRRAARLPLARSFAIADLYARAAKPPQQAAL